jgi:P27 family predicted phage terminase small subunit
VSAPTGHGRGRPPKPAALRLLQGNPGKRKVNPEPAPAPGECPPPGDLSPAACELWQVLAPELVTAGLLAPRYRATFALFCESYVNWRRAADLVAKAGPLVQRGDNVVSNPASREFARYAFLVRAFGAEFGLTPAAVTGMARRADDEDDKLSPSRLLGF